MTRAHYRNFFLNEITFLHCFFIIIFMLSINSRTSSNKKYPFDNAMSDETTNRVPRKR